MPPLPTQSVFDLVLARPPLGPGGEAPVPPGAVHLWWSAPQQGERLVQVYVDGELVDVSTDPLQREMWLCCTPAPGGGPGRAHVIELLAVPTPKPGAGADTDLLWRARPELLRSWDPPTGGAAEVALLRDERLPVDTRITVKIDGREAGGGPLWAGDVHRGGFGGLFGLGEFGWDAVTGPGLGVSGDELGFGPLGAGGSAWRFRCGELPAGTHEVELSAADAAGCAVTGPVMLNVTVDSPPGAPAATELNVTPDFTLQWK